jgi:hypothetical protein
MMQLLILFTVGTGASAFLQYNGPKPHHLNHNFGMKMSTQSASEASSVLPYFKILDWKIATPIMRVITLFCAMFKDYGFDDIVSYVIV